MSNTANAITVLTNLKTLITSAEADGIRTGNVEIDAETRRLLTTRIDQFLAAVFDNGSRSQQNTAAATRGTANNGLLPAIDATYAQLDTFVRAIDTQIAVLNNPTSVPRRQHNPLL